jgi:hypothetical protein
MKVALLCISIEPGRDGVGDYVRHLAQVLSARGHACQVVALADRFADRCSVVIDPEHGFQIVRLRYTDWQHGNIRSAVEQVTKFQPDWASLQMVCYGFEHHGMLWRSARRFAQLRLAPHRHIMLHELWIGAGRMSSPKERAIGWLQRRLLLRAMRAWAPNAVHTSNSLYREMLRGAGVVADELAIPSNIPVIQIGREGMRDRLERRLSRGSASASQPLLGGMFGHLPPELATGEWLECLVQTCARVARDLVIVQLGRSGPRGAGVISALRERSAGRVRFLELGELPTAEVSAVLQGLDFGIAPTPWPLIGKSGSAAAMIEHGLPVLVPREGDALRDGSQSSAPRHPQLYRLREFCEALETARMQHASPKPQTNVYERFIDVLERAL